MHPNLSKLRGGLIVSCQAPTGSPLRDPWVIGAMARSAENNGAVAVRLDTPEHLHATKARLSLPIIALWKVVSPPSEVYITPTQHEVRMLKSLGADILALDATQRQRPQGETLAQLIKLAHQEPYCPVLADISTLAEAKQAVALGADAVATTLCGYTQETQGTVLPAWDLLQALLSQFELPVILEGGVSQPEEVERALALGAWAVVVGTALTGLDPRIRQFVPTPL